MPIKDNNVSINLSVENNLLSNIGIRNVGGEFVFELNFCGCSPLCFKDNNIQDIINSLKRALSLAASYYRSTVRLKLNGENNIIQKQSNPIEEQGPITSSEELSMAMTKALCENNLSVGLHGVYDHFCDKHFTPVSSKEDWEARVTGKRK
jgi:hypothetical protein